MLEEISISYIVITMIIAKEIEFSYIVITMVSVC